MRVVLIALLALSLGCQSKGATTAEVKATTDSVNAFLERQKDQFAHPDTTLDPMEDFLPTGDVAVALDGQLISSRDSLRATLREPSPPNASMEYGTKKIDVLAPGVAAVTVGVQARQEQGNMVAERLGVWSGVMAVRAGRTRILQQHMSLKPGTIKPK